MERVIKKLNEQILPIVQQKFGDAALILLSGSQGRALKDKTNETLDASDFDFIILYDKLPEKYPCALFSSLVVDFKDGDGNTTIDLKIIDKEYWEELKHVTRQFRRFPFLFRMMSEGYIIQDQDNIYPQYQQEAMNVVNQGPDKLSKKELQNALALVEAFEKELDKQSNMKSPMAMAFEAQFILGNMILTLHDQWESLTERVIPVLETSIPEENTKFQKALEEMISGNQTPIRDYLAETKRKIHEKSEDALTPDTYVPSYDSNDIDPSLKFNSEKAFFRIMLGQYGERFRTGVSRGMSRYKSLQSATWITSKKLVAYKEGRNFQFGEDFSNDCLPENRFHLNRVMLALQTSNSKLLEASINTLLKDWGGVNDGEQDRYYVEDQARRKKIAGLRP